MLCRPKTMLILGQASKPFLGLSFYILLLLNEIKKEASTLIFLSYTLILVACVEHAIETICIKFGCLQDTFLSRWRNNFPKYRTSLRNGCWICLLQVIRTACLCFEHKPFFSSLVTNLCTRSDPD